MFTINFPRYLYIIFTYGLKIKPLFLIKSAAPFVITSVKKVRWLVITHNHYLIVVEEES